MSANLPTRVPVRGAARQRCASDTGSSHAWEDPGQPRHRRSQSGSDGRAGRGFREREWRAHSRNVEAVATREVRASGATEVKR
jgi:hypothetical protein